MDKFVSILARQNPTIELECKNPDCKKSAKVKTEHFFGGVDSYEFVCPYCGKTTAYHNVKNELEKLKKQFKKMGISW